MLHTVAYRILTMPYEYLIGVLTFLPVYIPEIVLGKVLRHFVLFGNALFVGIASIYDLHASEMFFIRIEAGHARAAAVGQRDNAFETALHEYCCVHHPLGNVDRFGTQHRVDVIRDNAISFLEAKLLVGRFVLHVHHHALLQETEGEECLFAIGHVGFQFGIANAQTVHRFGFQSACLQVGHNR